jgi:hypothetical protein
MWSHQEHRCYWGSTDQLDPSFARTEWDDNTETTVVVLFQIFTCGGKLFHMTPLKHTILFERVPAKTPQYSRSMSKATENLLLLRRYCKGSYLYCWCLVQNAAGSVDRYGIERSHNVFTAQLTQFGAAVSLLMYCILEYTFAVSSSI